ncbi:diguanylate cyclase [Mycoplana sp. MJR14]|uniref:GGDEF domain-containing protein n=1 Tax=Mycoplana sp. MJR14 TaxID=3032583 RepID=UPI000DDA4EAD|nr:diguanylate cyclase [Mycoplana sp. MJR14]MDF1633598.1 diguanylate cyclase [Mycoplana sp. MJR14]
MFRDASTSGGLRSGHHAAAKAELATILPYGFLIAAALATGLHLVLAALHAPIRLLPLPEPGPGTQGPASSLLMAASVAALLAALGGLGFSALMHLRARFDRAGLMDPMSGVMKPEAIADTLEAAVVPGFVVLFGVAHFAFLASRHGTDAANRILRLVAEELSRTFHAPHQVGRSADGEFIVMLESQSPEDCILLVEEVRRSVTARPVATPSGAVAVVLSAGVARIVPNAPTSVTMEGARRALQHARDTASTRAVYAFDTHAKPMC